MLQLANVHGSSGVGLAVQSSLGALGHGFLDNVCNFLGCLRKHLVHVLGHGVRIAQVLRGALSCLGVRIQRRLVLF